MKFYIKGSVPKDVVEFFEMMEGINNKVNKEDDADVILCESDCEVKDVISLNFHDGEVIVKREGIEIARIKLYKNYFTSLWGFVKGLADGRASIVSRSWARKIVSGILQGMITLMEVEDKEGYSHSQRVAQLCIKFGRYLGLPEDEIEKLREHAMLHDVGKIGIEQLMLYSPTRIRTFENFPRDHTILGSVYLSTIELLWDVIPTVRHHHERWDGRGFPDGLKGEEIPFFARLVAICNYYDNLTNFVTSEWEGGPKSKEETLSIIEENAGKMFDPRYARKFVEFMGGES
ncbi:MAG: HD domain-containing protein [Thermotogaceae bacterium]|nr:HD domain-containing protein [Thermotogaceae bacterium]